MYLCEMYKKEDKIVKKNINFVGIKSFFLLFTLKQVWHIYSIFQFSEVSLESKNPPHFCEKITKIDK